MIKIVSIGGSCSSGKSYVGKQLAIALNSPLTSISLTNFFLPVSKCPKHEIYKFNLETPDSIDFNRFKETLNEIKSKLAKNPQENNIQVSKIDHEKEEKVNLQNPFYFHDPNNKIIYLVVEGHLIYCKKEIVELFDFKIFLNSDKETSYKRVLNKELFHSHELNKTKDWFDEMVWKHYLSFKDLQLNNSKSKVFESFSKDLFHQIYDYIATNSQVSKSIVLFQTPNKRKLDVIYHPCKFNIFT